jgi:hypothetical protein
MSDVDVGTEAEVSMEDFCAVLEDHCKMAELDPTMTKVLTLRAESIASQDRATARTIAESLLGMVMSLDPIYKRVVYPLVYLFYPDLVKDIYEPRVSTRERVTIDAVAVSVANGIAVQAVEITENAAPDALAYRQQLETLENVDLADTPEGAQAAQVTVDDPTLELAAASSGSEEGVPPSQRETTPPLAPNE